MSKISIRSTVTAGLAATALVVTAQASFAAGTLAQKCEGGKNDAAGKYAACLAKARKAFITTSDATKYGEALIKCEGKIAAGFSKQEAATATCPSNGDESAIENFVEACDSTIAAALAGGALGLDPITCADALDTCDSDLDGCGSDLSTCDSDLSGCEGDLSSCDSDLSTCDADLTSCFAATSRIPKTGQVTCANDAGTIIACAGSGRDGEYKAGDAPSLVNNGDGTITDNITGLMWEKLSDDGSIHDKDNTYVGLTAAIAKATALNGAAFAGHTDWRVPNVRELATIPTYEAFNPAVPAIFNTGCIAGCTVLTCSCTKSNIYFTSTDYFGYRPACWKINMTDGDIYAGDKVDTHYVRLVRTAH